MKTCIFSYYVTTSEPVDYRHKMLDRHEMLRLWYDHLRGPGRYRGDICLCTNADDIPLDGVRIIPVDMSVLDMRQFWCERVVRHERIPAHEYDCVFHFDLDILAVGDVNELFPKEHDNRLWTASSLFPVPHYWNAGDFFGRFRYAYLNRFSGWRHGVGYSAAVFGSRSEFFHPYMSHWARLIQEHKGPMPRLGDQSFLNLAAYKRLFPLAKFPLDVLMQKGWAPGGRARLLHFAGVRDRLRVMKKHSILGAPPQIHS